MKKSLEYRLLFALRVIQLDPNARVLFASGNRYGATSTWTALMNLPGKPSGLKYSLQGRRVTHENGGSLTVVDLEDPTNVCGMQISHVWVDEFTEEHQRSYVARLIRTPQNRPPSPEPSGIYDEWNVTRVQDY